MSITINEKELRKIVSELEDALALIANGAYLYEENYDGENEDILNEIRSGEAILESVIDSLEKLLKRGEKQ
jgi:exonuclease VII small subunit